MFFRCVVFEVWEIGIGQFLLFLKAPLFFFLQNFFSFLVQKNHLSLGLKSFLLDESELQPSKGKKDTKKKET